MSDVESLGSNQSEILAEVAEVVDINQVGFNVLGRAPFTRKFPQARRLGDPVREMKVGELIKVKDILNTDGMHTFFFVPVREDNFVGLLFGNLKIEVTDGETIKITGNCTIDGNLEVDGYIKATGEITAMAADPAKSISLSTHWHKFTGTGAVQDPVSPPTP